MQSMHYVFISSGGRTRTYDLRVMSPTSYQLLYSAMYFPIGLQRYVLKSIYANYFYPHSAILPIKQVFWNIETNYTLFKYLN